jgi:hypothetical protein
MALCHLDGRVPHQLLDRLERHATHREMAPVGVPQVVPSDAALLAADVRLAKRTLQRALHGAVRVRLPVRLTEHVGAQMPVSLELFQGRARQIDRPLAPALGKPRHPAPDGPPDVQLAALQVHVAPLEPHQLPLPQSRFERHEHDRAPVRGRSGDNPLGFLKAEKESQTPPSQS